MFVIQILSVILDALIVLTDWGLNERVDILQTFSNILGEEICLYYESYFSEIRISGSSW